MVQVFAAVFQSLIVAMDFCRKYLIGITLALFSKASKNIWFWWNFHRSRIWKRTRSQILVQA